MPDSDAEAVERLVARATGVCRSMLAGVRFVYADREWDERPQDGNVFAEGFVAAARQLTTSFARPPTENEAAMLVELLGEDCFLGAAAFRSQLGNLEIVYGDPPPRLPPSGAVEVVTVER